LEVLDIEAESKIDDIIRKGKTDLTKIKEQIALIEEELLMVQTGTDPTGITY
jgi:hypothetical protein